jgi:hypothetical protein
VKLKYERFEGLGCLYVRGPVDDKFGRLLQIGVETIARDLEETLVVNLTHALVSPTQVPVLVEFKKKADLLTNHKLYWISRDRAFGDFPTVELLVSRMSGAKSRQIGERIKMDDEVYLLTLRTQELQEKILQLGGDEDNAIKLIMENASLKEQKRILETVVKYQTARAKLQVLEPSADRDIGQKIEEGLELLKQYYGREIDL